VNGDGDETAWWIGPKRFRGGDGSGKERTGVQGYMLAATEEQYWDGARRPARFPPHHQCFDSIAHCTQGPPLCGICGK
jgi:hypothetical protein